MPSGIDVVTLVARHQTLGAIERANSAVVSRERALILSLEGCASEAACFTETVWTRAHGDSDKADTLGAPWTEENWPGRSGVSHEQLCGCDKEQPNTER